jgi:hypothetical protein
VRRHGNAAYFGDKALDVVDFVVFVGSNRFLVGNGEVSRHRLGSIPRPPSC